MSPPLNNPKPNSPEPNSLELRALSRAELRVGALVGCGGEASVEEVSWAEGTGYLKRPLPELSQARAAALLCAELEALSALDRSRERGGPRLIARLLTETGTLAGLILRPLGALNARALVKLGEPLRPHEVAWLLCGVLTELERARRAGLVCHGDLRRSNLVIDERAELWLIDWSHATPQRETTQLAASEQLWAQELTALRALWGELVTGQAMSEGPALERRALISAGWPRAWAEAMEALKRGSITPQALPALKASVWGGASAVMSGEAPQGLSAAARAWISQRLEGAQR